MNIYADIKQLVQYGIDRGLIEEADRIFITNQYLRVLGLDDYEDTAEAERVETYGELEALLNRMVDWAADQGLVDGDSIVSRDLFDTLLMGVMTPRPSQVNRRFWDLYETSAQDATDWFYAFSQDTNYIRAARVARDMRWVVPSAYGDIDISINLSKPEKDPKAIAAARNASQVSYPACQLCVENEGYAGRMNHPARENHRIIPITIADADWGFQYSPYVYYNEHCIVLNSQHVPMAINRATFRKMFDFIRLFPHYFVGSNADLPIVGGSILAHDHFQGGHYEFAMERAELEKTFAVPGYEDVTAGIVHWPLSVVRLRGADPDRIIDLADHILGAWRAYTDEDAFVFAETDGEPHNTITPIARMRGDLFELDLALRNNITTDEFPLGVYHPHQEYHHIKKENIGLIEVMGLAVLPSRLQSEMAQLKQAILAGTPLEEVPELKEHVAWAHEFMDRYDHIDETNVDDIIKAEVGRVFVGVLEDAGVFKCTPEGRAAFDRFVATL